MSNIYESCPIIENERYLMRFVSEEDTDDLSEVYSDKNALPFFNSDNCDGDNFYYADRGRMAEAIRFWHSSYEKGWFVRWSVTDKAVSKVIGTTELFHRKAEDAFNEAGVLRVDVRSDYERSEVLRELFALIIPPSYDLFECTQIITKIPVYAIERIDAAQKYGFKRSDSYLIGTHDNYAYNGYWTISKE